MTHPAYTQDQLLTETDAAKLLSISPRTLRNWRVLGGGPHYVKVSGRCVRYCYADLNTFINQRRQTSTSTSVSVPPVS
ncbi:helix-turn-helix domain-containing protein [Hyphomonas sp.]|uniref:helix-turn-helix transcriptional regulator n=1 Tax=Hyphomonas sp. TaxID=87 RepID=UPI00345939C0